MKTARIVQHWLIPAALVSANTALVHLLYLLSLREIPLQSLYILICLTGLIVGTLTKNKYTLIVSNAAYWIILLLVLFGGIV